MHCQHEGSIKTRRLYEPSTLNPPKYCNICKGRLCKSTKKQEKVMVFVVTATTACACEFAYESRCAADIDARKHVVAEIHILAIVDQVQNCSTPLPPHSS